MADRGDNPIKNSADDTLGRAASAKAFALQLQKLDASEGLVVGVLGPWGSGKTSYVNLVKDELSESITVIDFNPWMFSGANQLVDAFFVEVGAELQLKDGKLQDIGRDLEDYGEALSGLGWLPVIGSSIERIRLVAKATGKLFQRKNKKGTGAKRKKLYEALAKLENPIVVVIDDIDRLNTDEIRDIFKLVRLTASFPHIIYVLAFDRTRVEDALSEQGIPGRDYLEKILQLAIDLPVAPPEVLNKEIFANIGTALEGIENEGPFNQTAWPDIYYEVIRPLIRNMRDVKRYALAVKGTVVSLEGKVALQDVLALEAIRIFLPDVFQEIIKSSEGLTTPWSGYIDSSDPPRLKESIERLVKSAGEHEKLIKDLINRVFPSAERHLGNTHYGHDSHKQWLKDRRMAHESILRFYLEKQGNEKLQAFTNAEIAFSKLGNENELDKYLRSLNPAELEGVISSLETFEDDFAHDAVVPAIAVLLNLMPDIPEKEVRDMFELDTRMVVGRVVYRLIKSLPDQNAVETAVTEIMPRLKSLTAKYEIITDVGYRKGAGHKLVSEEFATTLERQLRDEVRSASGSKLAKEDELLRLLLLTAKEAQDDEPPFNIPTSKALTHAILLSGKSQVRSNTMGNRAVKTKTHLAWDTIVDLFVSEEEFKRRVNLSRSKYPEDKELYDLFDKYASGWRPSRDD